MKKLRILIADYHGLVRPGARALLQARRSWRAVGEAANGREAEQMAIELKPDVAPTPKCSASYMPLAT